MPPSSYLPTFSGNKFDFLHPTADSIDLHDIAHSLAGLPRYLRHTTRTLTVAEHTARMLKYLQTIGMSGRILRYTALHDAPEAYIGEWPKPLKLSIIGSNIRVYEKAIERIILKKYDAIPTDPMLEVVTMVDRAIVYAETELAGLMPYELLPIKLDAQDIALGKEIYARNADKEYGWKDIEAENTLLRWFSVLGLLT